MSVDVGLNGGTATGGSDFTHTLPMTITFADGDIADKAVAATIVGDTTYEPDETILLELTKAQNAVLGPITQTTYTINNDDSQPTVTLGVDKASIAEAGGVATLTATLSNLSYQDVTVSLSTAGTATGGGIDYTLSSSTIVIAAGSTSGTATLTAQQDSLVEAGGETVNIEIASVTNGTESGTQQASTTITDDDKLPDTSLTGKPSDPSTSAAVSFSFSGTSNTNPTLTLSYECKLDGGAFAACTSPFTQSGLADGAHTFAVQAKDNLGNTAASPASFTWTINVPTVTPLPTNTPTNTPLSTNTSTPNAIELTATAGGATLTPTWTPTNTPLSTNTSTPNAIELTATAGGATLTPTWTPTNTPLPTNTPTSNAVELTATAGGATLTPSPTNDVYSIGLTATKTSTPTLRRKWVVNIILPKLNPTTVIELTTTALSLTAILKQLKQLTITPLTITPSLPPSLGATSSPSATPTFIPPATIIVDKIHNYLSLITR